MEIPRASLYVVSNAAEDAGPFGIIAYISKSCEFRNVPFSDEYWFLKAFSDNVDLNGNEYELDINQSYTILLIPRHGTRLCSKQVIQVLSVPVSS